MSQAADRKNVVRPGDVFRFDETRFATVMYVRPGGNAGLRISGTLNGRPSLRIGEQKVAEIKTWPRIGRAEYLDGSYLPLDHDALAGA